MSFKNIKGQDSAINFLKGAVSDQRIAHAYIFLGPEGVGRRMTALNFAKALNCGKKDAEPCDSCPSCRKIDSGTHPDVFMVTPEEDETAIKIQRVRGLIDSIGLKPYEGRKKVYIIDDAGAMTQEAANAFLKTLEEPPPDSILILLAQDLNLLLPTITSRAQILKFFPLAAEKAKDILQKEYGMDEASAHILSNLSSGRIGEALKYRDEHFLEKRARIIKNLIDKSFLDFDETPKADLKMCLNVMLTWYRDLLVAGVSPEGNFRPINIDRLDDIKTQARKYGYAKINEIIKNIISTDYFLGQSANPKLAMAALTIGISED